VRVMPGRDSPLPFAISTVASLALWAATATISGRREPWDAGFYWTMAYPAAVLLSGLLGYFFPQSPWRWAVIVMLMQLGVMLAAGSDPSLLPLGLALVAVLSLPAIAVAMVSAKLSGSTATRS